MSHSPALFLPIFFGGWVRNYGFMFTEFVTWGGRGCGISVMGKTEFIACRFHPLISL